MGGEPVAGLDAGGETGKKREIFFVLKHAGQCSDDAEVFCGHGTGDGHGEDDLDGTALGGKRLAQAHAGEDEGGGEFAPGVREEKAASKVGGAFGFALPDGGMEAGPIKNAGVVF